MSQRLIKHWGKNAGEAFGPNGYKGVKGEHWFADYYISKGNNVVLFEGVREKQKLGIDAIITTKDGNTLTVDVKNNLRTDNSFYVEILDDGWLFKKTYINEFVGHVNTYTGVIGMYAREHMKRYILDNYPVRKSKTIILNKETPGLNFIHWTYTKNSS